MSKTICIFGDSITWGAYDPKNGGWVTLLRNNLEPKDGSVYNCGISGDNTDDLLKRFKVEAKARKPEVVIFAVGINDSQYTNSRENSRVPKARFIANLHTLIEQAKELTNSILFVGLTNVEESKLMPIPWSSKDKNYDNANASLYNSFIEEVCKDYDLPFLNILDLLGIKDLHDGLHPNSNGHQKIFERVKEFLLENKII